jgi:hypothetical protein
MIIATIIFGIIFILGMATFLGDDDGVGAFIAAICVVALFFLICDGCTTGWTDEARDAHYMQERTELVEELKAAKNSDYMKYLLREKIDKFNKAHEDDIKLIIDFDAVLKGEAE